MTIGSRLDEELAHAAIEGLSSLAPEVSSVQAEWLDIWLRSSGPDRDHAALELTYGLIGGLLRNIGLLDEGQASRLSETKVLWSFSEDVIRDVLVTMGGKFYRDHLNHVLRVAFLAAFLLGISPELSQFMDIRLVVLAALFHDIAIPIEKFRTASNVMGEYLRHAYEAYMPPAETVRLEDVGVVLGLGMFQSRVCPEVAREVLESAIRAKNHALFGAVELEGLTRVRAHEKAIDEHLPGGGAKKTLEHVRKILRAILFHDIRMTRAIDAETDPYAALLIISDEAQDWGRPGRKGEPPALNDLKLAADGAHWAFEFDYRSNSSVPVLRTIYDKIAALSRIRYIPPFPNCEFSFLLGEPVQTLGVRDLLIQLLEVLHVVQSSQHDAVRRLREEHESEGPKKLEIPDFVAVNEAIERAIHELDGDNRRVCLYLDCGSGTNNLGELLLTPQAPTGITIALVPGAPLKVDISPFGPADIETRADLVLEAWKQVHLMLAHLTLCCLEVHQGAYSRYIDSVFHGIPRQHLLGKLLSTLPAIGSDPPELYARVLFTPPSRCLLVVS